MREDATNFQSNVSPEAKYVMIGKAFKRGGKGEDTKPGYPKFTNEVQHFVYKVLQWENIRNSCRWKNVVQFPSLAKPGKQSAKSRQLWIARHRP